MIEITKVMQPKGSNLCGQAIIAMLGNIDIQEAIKLMEKTGGTRTKDIIQALNKIGLKAASHKLIRIPKNWKKPMLCIVHLGFGKHWKKHWTLWIGIKNCFYDPALSLIIRDNFYISCGVKMLSYLEIKGK